MRISMTKPRGASSLSRQDDNKRIGKQRPPLLAASFHLSRYSIRPQTGPLKVRRLSGEVLTAPKRHFRLNPINGHRQTGAVGPIRANGGHEGRYLSRDWQIDPRTLCRR
jgi:hypothetical protein